MNAIDLLTQQHQEVSALFKKFEAAEDGRTRRALFDAIGTRLAAHDAIEREIFYPACKAALGKESEELGEALVEHGVVEFSIHKAASADAEDLPHCVKVLKDIVEHHVEEEQDELFPKVKKAISASELLALGEEMEQRFEEALETDFRVAVRANLAQVVGGAMETEPVGEGERVPARKAPKKAAAKGTKKTSRPAAAAKRNGVPTRKSASGKAAGSRKAARRPKSR
jgi:hemerythrin superfamily protein